MSTILKVSYPWIRTPLLVSAPMLNAATPALAVNVSRAGGLGFIAADAKPKALDNALNEVSSLLPEQTSGMKITPGILPIGVGFQTWAWDLGKAAEAIEKHVPAVAWLFAPSKPEDFRRWAKELRRASKGRTHIWIQVGSVQEARQAVELAEPSVLIVQGADAGGHGLAQSASVVSLVPETIDALATDGIRDLPILAAGGIVDGRGMAGALALGAAGVVMGTRFLAATEAGIAKGWQRELLRVNDGGVSTIRSTLCDRLKETVGWPQQYDGRFVVNKGHTEERSGLSDVENVALYKEELKQGDEAWGPDGRMVTYAGTGVGLVKEVKPAAMIVEEVLRGARDAIAHAAGMCDKGASKL